MESIVFRGQHLDLHPERAIYWREQQALLLADLHLGKGAHFRKAGIAVPAAVSDGNFRRLRTLLATFEPVRVLLLGDLFHSDYNHVWEMFADFLEDYPAVSFELIPGNHDILPAAVYARSRLVRQPLVLTVGPFSLSHHPLTEAQLPAGTYNLHGHVHPGVRLVDRAGSGLKLPAFHFGENAGILPAFGEFTGCVEVPVRVGDRVFVLLEGTVVGV
ncbi:MAG: ligase-associated DNA damage response endonuclease PdeM [Bacteroidota bacterium]